MNKKYWPFIITAISSLMISFMYCPPYDLYFDDKEIFKYTGFLIQKGKVPYKDFFDHKPPLIYFFNYLYAVAGSWFFWFIDACLVLFASLQFLKLNIKYKIHFAFVLPVLFNLILRSSYISFGIGMTREYTTIFLLLIFCLIFCDKKISYFYIGLITTLLFFMQQDQIVIAAPLIIYVLFKNPKKIIQHLFLLSTGIMAITLPIILYFSINHALNDFWQDAFIFNAQWYTSPANKPGVITEIIKLKNYIYQFRFEIIFSAAIILGIISLWIGNQKKWLLIATLICIPLSFISEFLSGKLAIGDAVCTYYLLPLATTIPITIFMVFAFTERNIFQNKVHQLIYSCLFLLNPIMSTAEHITNFHKYPQDQFIQSEEIKYLEKDPPKDYELYVFSNSNYTCAYNKFKILIPSKWLYHHFWSWYPNWDKDNTIIYSIIDDLKIHQTKYIMDFSDETGFKAEKDLKIWKGFLDSSYQRIYPLKLWEMKE